MIRQFDSIAALGTFAQRECQMTNRRDSWSGWETTTEIMRKTLLGDTALVPAAERLIDKLDAQIETPRRVWERAPVGAFCSVPDVLAGLPTPMRRQRETGDEHAPITILASMNSSAAITPETLRARGTAILALTLVLARTRPITLHSLFLGDGRDGETIFTAQINTAPLDLATACYALTSVSFYRVMGFAIAEHLGGFCGGWPKRFSIRDEETRGGYFHYLAETLTPDADKTLVIGPAGMYDKLVTDPVAWLNAQIARFTSQETDA